MLFLSLRFCEEKIELKLCEKSITLKIELFLLWDILPIYFIKFLSYYININISPFSANNDKKKLFMKFFWILCSSVYVFHFILFKYTKLEFDVAIS